MKLEEFVRMSIISKRTIIKKSVSKPMQILLKKL